MQKKYQPSRDVIIVLIGISLIFFSQTPSGVLLGKLSKVIETIGIGVSGYGAVQFILFLFNYSFIKREVEKTNQLFKRLIKIRDAEAELPYAFAFDIEGCITPPNREEINLRKFQKLRAYCDFIKENNKYPPIIIYTGRSQGYVELLAQSLGMLDCPNEQPFVIENGSALYFPSQKKTVSLVNKEQKEKTREALILLLDRLPDNEFEPKTYMITVNPKVGQSTDELREIITIILKDSNLLKNISITNTASAVDITAKGIDKMSGIVQALKCLSDKRADILLKEIVSVGDHISDLQVLRNSGTSYCPAENVHAEVRSYVDLKHGKKNIINKDHIDFVLEVIERECKIKIL